MHSFSEGRLGGYTFRSVHYRNGSSSKRRRGSRRSRDGRGSSGTRLGEGLDAFDVSEGTVGELGVSATRVFGDGRCTWQT